MADHSYENISFYDLKIVERPNIDFKILKSELIQNTIYEDYPVSDEGGAIIEKQMENFKSVILENRFCVQIINDKLKKGIVERVKKMIDTYFLIKNKINRMLYLKEKADMITSKMEKRTETIIQQSSWFQQKQTKISIDESFYELYKKITQKLELDKLDEFMVPIHAMPAHAIGTYFKKINDDEFLFYIINTGAGCEYQSIENNLKDNMGIMGFKINKEKLNFIYSILLFSNRFITIDAFYNVVLRVLFTDVDKIFSEYDTFRSNFLIDSPFFYKGIKTKMQVRGNCTNISIISVLEIIDQEDIIINENKCFNRKENYTVFMNKLRIVLLNYSVKDFVHLKNEYLNDNNYGIFIKLNETYKLLANTPENNNTNQQTGKLLNKIYEYYMDKIENYTNIESIDLREKEKECHKLTYLKRIKKNIDFDLSYLKEPSEVTREKMDKYISDMELLFQNLKSENINLINNIVTLNDKLNKVSNIFDIIMVIRTKTEDIIICRYFQYRLIDIIINIYKKIKYLILENKLEGKLNKKENDNLISNCLNIFKNINLLNRDYFKVYYKINNNHSTSGYKYSIYDIPLLYLLIIIGNIHDYYNIEKVVDNEMSDLEVTDLIDKIFSVYVINDSDEMLKIGELIHELKKNNNIKYFIKKNNNSLNKIAQSGLPEPPGLTRAGRDDYSYGMDLEEVINMSSFNSTKVKEDKELDAKVKYEYNELKKNYYFIGDIDFSRFKNICEISEDVDTTADFFDLLDTKILKPNNLSWLLVFFNFEIFNLRITAINYTNDEYKHDIKIIDSLKKLNILIKENSLGENNDSIYNLNESIMMIEKFFNKKELISSSPYDWDIDNKIHFKKHSIKLGNIMKIKNDEVCENTNLTTDFNVLINFDIFNGRYFEKLLIYIGKLFEMKEVKKNQLESIFDVMLTIINIFSIINYKIDKTNLELIKYVNIIISEFSPIIGFLFNKYHDINYDYNFVDILNNLDKAIKFNKSHQINHNSNYLKNELYMLINLIFKKIDNKEMYDILVKNDNYQKIIIHDINITHLGTSLGEVQPTNYLYYLHNTIDNVNLLIYCKKVSKFKVFDNKNNIRIYIKENFYDRRRGDRDERVVEISSILNEDAKISDIEKSNIIKKNNENLLFNFNNLNFNFEKYKDGYDRFILRNITFKNTNDIIKIFEKNVFFHEENSLLQKYYTFDYSYLNSLDYYLENKDSYDAHVSKYKDDNIRVLLGDNINVTINGKKVLQYSDLFSPKNSMILSIFIKLLKFCNSNIDDRPSVIDRGIRNYLSQTDFNELVPIVIQENKIIHFICHRLNTYFKYDIENNKLYHLEDKEIVITKSYYFINRYIYKSDCLLIKDNFKYTIMNMGRDNKKINFTNYNYNGLFFEKNNEAIVYLLKVLINNNLIYEINDLLNNLNQNNILKNHTDACDVNIHNLDNNNIYSSYIIKILNKYNFIKLFNNRDLVIQNKKYNTNINSLLYFHRFNFDLLNKEEVNGINNSICTNKEYKFKEEEGKIYNTDNSISKVLYMYNLLLNKDNTIEIDIKVEKSTSAIEDCWKSYNYHKTNNILKPISITKPILVHKNRKVRFDNTTWNTGENLCDTINFVKEYELTPKIKENIDIDKISNKKNKEEIQQLLQDYNAFHKVDSDKQKNIVTKEQLITIINKITPIMEKYIELKNTRDKEINSSLYENMINVDKINSFDKDYLNIVLLLYKYSNALDELKSYLSVDKKHYDLTRFVEKINYKPIYIDNEVNSSLIIFEYIFGIQIRPGQYEFVKKLYNEILCKEGSKPNLHQMLMGEGKSSVIAPVLTLELLLNDELEKSQQIYHVMPESLIRQSYNIFNKLFYYLGERNIGFNTLFENKLNIVSDYLVKYKKVTSKMDDNFSMKKHLLIFDEVDEISDPLKSQLNILNTKPIKLTKNIDILSFIHDFMYNLYFNPEKESLRKKLLSYNFSMIPHLICQSDEVHPKALTLIYELYEEIILKVFGSKYVYYYNKILENDFSEEPKKDEINLYILNNLIHFYELIPLIIKQLHRRHFGLKYNKYDSLEKITKQKGKEYIIKYNLQKIRSNFIAVPFVSSENPSDKSEFTDYLYTSALTIICYYEKSIRRIRNIDLQIYLDYIINIYLASKYKPIEKNMGIKLYEKLIENVPIKDKITLDDKVKITDYSKENIEKIIEKFPIDKYLKDILLEDIILVNNEFDNISFCDIIHSWFTPSRIGFTGTPFIHKPIEFNKEFEIKNILKQPLGDGAIISSITGFNESAKLIDTVNNYNDIIDLVKTKYNCLIDVGSYFINEENEKIAEKILIKLKETDSNIKCVVFIDKKTHEFTALLENNIIIPESSLSISLKDRFYYFDQAHITGMDAKIFLDAKGLITISSFNRFRDVAQGIYRMRNINYGQKVDFCFNNNFKQLLIKKNMKLIEYLIYNEFKYKISQEPLFLQQTLLTLYRTYFESINKYNLPEIPEQFNYLHKNIYRQSVDIGKIESLNEVKNELINKFIKENEEVIKIIVNKDLSAFITEHKTKLMSLEIKKAGIDEIENLEIDERREEKEEEREEKEIEQQVDEKIMVYEFSNIPVLKKNCIPISEYFNIDLFTNDIIDINFAPKLPEGSEIIGTMPKTKEIVKPTGWGSYKKFIKCNYTFRKIINNIFIPIINIQFKSQLDLNNPEGFQNINKFEIDSYLEIYDHRQGINYGKFKYFIILNTQQSLKIINHIEHNKQKKLIQNKYLIKYKLLSGETYYESNQDVEKIITKEHINNTKLVELLLGSNKVTNLDIFNNFDMFKSKIDEGKINIEVLNKLNLNKKNSSLLYNLCGTFTKKDLYKIMIIIKMINDYNTILPQEKIYNLNKEDLDNLLEKTCENLSRCTDKDTCVKYEKVLCDKTYIDSIRSKFELFYKKFISINTDNILNAIIKNKKNNYMLWDLIKEYKSLKHEYDDTNC